MRNLSKTLQILGILVLSVITISMISLGVKALRESRLDKKSDNLIKKEASALDTPDDVREKLTSYFLNVQKELGDDNFGKAGFLFFIRAVSPAAMAQHEKTKNICVRQEGCPVKLSEVYLVDLERLDRVGEGEAKEILQDSLLVADIPTADKLRLLTNCLLTTRIPEKDEPIKVAKSGDMEIGRGTKYLMATFHQMQKLNPVAAEFQWVVLSTVKRLKDPVAKKTFLTALYKAYPKDKAQISAQMRKLGMGETL